MAITLADLLQLSTISQLEKSVIFTILDASPFAQLLPFEDIGDLQVVVHEARDLPTPTHSPLNPSSITVVNVAWQQRTETLRMIRDKIPIDRQLLNNKSALFNLEAESIRLYSEAVAYELVRVAFRGDPATTVDEPPGLEYKFLTDGRLSDGTAAPSTQKQVVDGNNQNGDMTASADRLKLINGMHELASLIAGGMPDVFVTNRETILAMGEALRAERMFAVTKDMFGRRVMTFGEGGPPIIDAGDTVAGAKDRSTQVLPTSTSANDLISDSVYAIKFGKTMCTGLQKGSLDVQRHGENSADWPNKITTFEWVYNPIVITNFSAVAVLRRAA